MALTLSWPPRVVNGRAVLVEIDSPEHVAQCTVNAVSTEQGWRVDAPDFGVPSYLLAAGGVDLDELRACLERSEPRAAAAVSRIGTPPTDRQDLIRILLDEGT